MSGPVYLWDGGAKVKWLNINQRDATSDYMKVIFVKVYFGY